MTFSILKPLSPFAITLKYLAKNFRMTDLTQLELEKSKWSQETLNALNINLTYQSEVELESLKKQSQIWVANHMSYLDIVCLFALCPWVSFVSKIEVSKWPIIGQGAKKVGTIFINRASQNSRNQVRHQLKAKLQDPHVHIAIFPSGTTSVAPTLKWKKGIFQIASELNIPVVPIQFNYSPLRQAAYIDDDSLIGHLFKLNKSPVTAHIRFGKPTLISEDLKEMDLIKNWCESIHL